MEWRYERPPFHGRFWIESVITASNWSRDGCFRKWSANAVGHFRLGVGHIGIHIDFGAVHLRNTRTRIKRYLESILRTCLGVRDLYEGSAERVLNELREVQWNPLGVCSGL